MKIKYDDVTGDYPVIEIKLDEETVVKAISFSDFHEEFMALIEKYYID